MHDRIDACGVFSNVPVSSYLLISCYALCYVNYYVIKAARYLCEVVLVLDVS